MGPAGADGGIGGDFRPERVRARPTVGDRQRYVATGATGNRGAQRSTLKRRIRAAPGACARVVSRWYGPTPPPAPTRRALKREPRIESGTALVRLEPWRVFHSVWIWLWNALQGDGRAGGRRSRPVDQL